MQDSRIACQLRSRRFSGLSKRIFSVATLFFSLVAASTALAQTYPDRAITIIVPFNAGTGVDIITRELAKVFRLKLGQPVVVENKPGAGTLLASRYVANAAPDGYTLFLSGSSSVLAPELNPSVNDKSYVREMAQIGPLALVPNLIAVSGDLPVRTLGEFIAYLRANPGKVNYATPGVGSSPHLQTELFQQLTGTKMVHVPYKGYDSLLPDLAAGRVQMTITAYASMRPYVEARQVRVLAVTTSQRVAVLPELPTAVESGLSGFSVEPWIGLAAPKGTPASIVEKLNQLCQETLNDPEFKGRLTAQFLQPILKSPAEFREFVDRDVERSVRIIKDAQIKIE